MSSIRNSIPLLGPGSRCASVLDCSPSVSPHSSYSPTSVAQADVLCSSCFQHPLCLSFPRRKTFIDFQILGASLVPVFAPTPGAPALSRASQAEQSPAEVCTVSGLLLGTGRRVAKSCFLLSCDEAFIAANPYAVAILNMPNSITLRREFKNRLLSNVQYFGSN